jgi:glutaminase
MERCLEARFKDQAMDLDSLMHEIARVARPEAANGEVASYIPSIASMDPNCFGLSMVEIDGQEHVTGDADVAFPIQSISKVFALVLAMQLVDAGKKDARELQKRVGREPSGDPFNSLVQLEHEHGIPRNPMINAGALVIDDVILEHCQDPKNTLLTLVSQLAGEPIGLDETVLRQEGRRGHRNRAMAYLLSSFGNLPTGVEDVIDLYVHQCAIAMTTRQLARAMRFLANDGVDPASKQEILSPGLARRVAAIMLTCGTYDEAGEFAFNVGIPCKSGVAGGIVGVVPRRAAVCVWSPPLDPSGNSRAGRIALHELTERLELSLF